MFRELDPTRIVSTATVLKQRVDERFPSSNLVKVASELEAIARDAAQVSRWLGTPNVPLRIALGIVIAVFLAILGVAFANVRVDTHLANVSDLAQGLEAFINDIVFLGIAVYFLGTIEARRKRNRALSALHELRAIAHIIDMHQLTKDPERIVRGGQDTTSSPQRHMTPFELTRYLDYCSEMLAILGKIASLYVQRFNDPVTVSAANEVENLTVSLSRNIWQKIVILDRILEAEK